MMPNVKVGAVAYEQWGETVGPFVVGEANERGERRLEFANKHKVTLVNTLFSHKLSRRTTWHSPDGVTRNQIDHILTSWRFTSNINGAKSRTFPRADINSDRDLVMITMKPKLKKTLQSLGARLDDSAAMQSYTEISREIGRRMKDSKENWITYRCKEIDSGIRTGNSKVAFDTLKLLIR